MDSLAQSLVYRGSISSKKKLFFEFHNSRYEEEYDEAWDSFGNIWQYIGIYILKLKLEHT